MKSLTISILLAVMVIAACNRSSDDKQAFNEWSKRFKKSYKDHEERSEAMEKFLANKQRVDRHNRLYEDGKKKYKLGLWEHADLSHEEMRQLMTGLKVPEEHRSKRAYSGSYPTYPPPPFSIDWTKKGLVGPVENQSKKRFFSFFK